MLVFVSWIQVIPVAVGRQTGAGLGSLLEALEALFKSIPFRRQFLLKRDKKICHQDKICANKKTVYTKKQAT